jgi:hypothetical protein
VSGQAPQTATEHAGQQSTEEAMDRRPTLEELNEQREALGVRSHREANREHFTYRLVETHPYRLVPGGWL